MNDKQKELIKEWLDAHTVICGPCNDIISLGTLFDAKELIDLVERGECMCCIDGCHADGGLRVEGRWYCGDHCKGVF